jgi:hypothetical protein
MCGGGPTTTTTSTSSPDKATAKLNDQFRSELKSLTAGGREFQSKYGTDLPDEIAAYLGIRNNSGIAEGYMPDQQALISQLYGGGGLGEGMDYIRDAYGQASNAYQPYLSEGYLDPMSNPYLQPAIEAARSSAFNDVASRFHQAGRSFSGAEAGAFGKGATSAALPMLLGQYNQNVGAQQGAAQGLLGSAIGASGGLDASQQGRLQAQMAAPGQIGNLNIPENMQLGIADRQRQQALEAMQLRATLLHGTPFTPGSSSTSTSQTQSDPFQTMLGGGLGLLGAFL